MYLMPISNQTKEADTLESTVITIKVCLVTCTSIYPIGYTYLGFHIGKFLNPSADVEDRTPLVSSETDPRSIDLNIRNSVVV